MELKKQKGANLAEFALVLPILLLLFFGIVDFGILFGNYQALTQAARDSARFAVAPPPGAASPNPPQDPAAVAQRVCANLVGAYAPGTCASYGGGGTPPQLATCVVSGGSIPSTDDVYVTQCSLPQPNGLTLTFTEVDIRKTVSLPLLPDIPLHTTAAMRNETN